MELHRTFAPEVLDAILNDPTVRPTIETKAKGRIDSTPLVCCPSNIVIVGEAGAAIFAGLGVGRYVGHIAVPERYRGRLGLDLGRGALAMLFGAYGAACCRCEIPLGLPQAILYVRRLGFVSLGRDPDRQIEHLVKEAA